MVVKLSTVNNGWVVISVKYGFIRLLQRIFMWQNSWHQYYFRWSTEHSGIWIIFLRHHIHELHTVKNGQNFHGLNYYFWGSMVSPNLCQEYLNMATFWILLLLLIKSSTFWYIDRLPTSSYMYRSHTLLKMVRFFLAHPVGLQIERKTALAGAESIGQYRPN